MVFEQGAELGGVWVYDADVEDDLTGADANRAKRVHSSVYKNLRTNLPREVMGFGSFPFTRAFTDDNRRFCGHEEVRAYLDAYADHHDIRKRVRLGTRVVAVTPTSENTENAALRTASASDEDERAYLEKWGPRWRVVTEPVETTRKEEEEEAPREDGEESVRERRPSSAARSARGETDRASYANETFDAVVVCNGHYSEPRVPRFPGHETWPGLQMHSHNYREPEGPGAFSFRGKRVVVLGAAASGEDLSREIASVAAEVILASRGFAPPKDASSGDFPLDSYPRNMRRAPGITALLPETSGVAFEDGSARHDVDVVLYATGYRVTFPFFASFDGEEEQEEQASASDSESRLAPRSVDNRVAPLFEHVFPPASGPSLSFIGLPWKVVPFPQFEAQARWAPGRSPARRRSPAARRWRRARRRRRRRTGARRR